MNDKTTIPFETKTLFLKQVRAADLDDIEKLALYFFFPDHQGTGFEQAKYSKKSLLSDLQEFVEMQKGTMAVCCCTN